MQEKLIYYQCHFGKSDHWYSVNVSTYSMMMQTNCEVLTSSWRDGVDPQLRETFRTHTALWQKQFAKPCQQGTFSSSPAVCSHFTKQQFCYILDKQLTTFPSFHIYFRPPPLLPRFTNAIDLVMVIWIIFWLSCKLSLICESLLWFIHPFL